MRRLLLFNLSVLEILKHDVFFIQLITERTSTVIPPNHNNQLRTREGSMAVYSAIGLFRPELVCVLKHCGAIVT
jgi:hypothetical protein